MTSSRRESGGPWSLKGRTAVVTGGSRGVGRATALLLAEAGAGVGIAYRSREEEARETMAAVTRHGVRGWAFAGDLTEPAAVEALFGRVDEAFGEGLDILVVNHGIWPPEPVAFSEMSEDQWARTVSVNLDSVYHVLRRGLPRIRPGGRVVLVSSTAGQRGEAYHGDYAATKGALLSLVKGLCVEVGARGITVNAVAPGWIDTEMAAPALAEDRERIEASIPLGRVATARDVAGPILFLCSELGRHVTGEVLNVNGGAVLVG
jgi:3-oxoacyl-[acyl-carrier protein] reductase